MTSGNATDGMERKRECPVCDGSGYEPVHAGVIECDHCNETGYIQPGTERDDSSETGGKSE